MGANLTKVILSLPPVSLSNPSKDRTMTPNSKSKIVNRRAPVPLVRPVQLVQPVRFVRLLSISPQTPPLLSRLAAAGTAAHDWPRHLWAGVV